MQAARPKSRRAFTLIELLVVIAIMMLLLGMLAPGLARARRRGQLAACSNNLKQLGVAIMMYTDDHDGRIAALSGWYPTWTSNVTYPAWTQLLYPYVNSTKVFRDPAWPKWMPDLPVSYYLNLLPGALVSNETVVAGRYNVDLRAVRHPSAFVLLSEDLEVNPELEIDPTNEKSDRTGFSGTVSNNPPIHEGYSNFLFADGHVAKLSQSETNSITYWYHTIADWAATVPP